MLSRPSASSFLAASSHLDLRSAEEPTDVKDAGSGMDVDDGGV